MKSYFNLIMLIISLIINSSIYSQSSPQKICEDDDRISSSDYRVGRIWLRNKISGLFEPDPAGTAFIIANGKFITAGHVFGENPPFQSGVVEFAVPNSIDGQAQHPTNPNNIYEIITSSVISSQDWGSESGNDWAVFEVDETNGETPISRYDVWFSIMQTSNLQTIRITGFGIDSDDPTNTLDYTQQTAVDVFDGYEELVLKYLTDTEGGNSGSPIIDEHSGLAVGVHTGGNCQGTFGYNHGTSFYNEDFWDATGLSADFTVDQVDEDDERLVGTNVGRWESFDFKEYQVLQNELLKFSAEEETYEVLRADQTRVSNPEEKYNNWLDIFDIENHRKIFIEAPVLFTSKFRKTYSGITLQNNFLEEPQLNPDDDEIEFKDPWFIDYQDPFYGNNLRNRGMDQAVWRSRLSPFNPNYDDPYEYGQTYKGVFLNQDPTFDPLLPNYSVKVENPQNIFLSETGKYHNFYFQDWSYDPNKISLQYPSSNETGIAFKTSDATITANLKGTQLSNDVDAYTNNSQRKFVSSYSGVLFSVYESMGKIWIEFSNDDGQTWQLGNNGKPLFGGIQAKNPSIEFYNTNQTEAFIFTVAQLDIGGESDIAVSWLKWSPSPFLEEMSFVNLPTFNDPYSTTELRPVIGMLATDFFMVAISGINTGVQDYLWMEVGELDQNYAITWHYQVNFFPVFWSDYDILNPTIYSTKPSLDQSQNEIYSCWLAYEEKIDDNYSNIYAVKMDLDYENPIGGDYQLIYSDHNNV